MPGSEETCAGSIRPRWTLGKLVSTRLIRAGFPPALRMFGALLQFAATVLIARHLGEEASGHFFFWSATLMSVAMIATFGLDKLALQQVPRLEGDPAALGGFLGPVRGISGVLSLAIGGLLICYAIWVQHEVEHAVWWYALLPLALLGLVMCRINAEVMKGLARPLLAVHYRNLLPATIFIAALAAMGGRLDPDSAMACFTLGFVVAGFAALRSSALAPIRPHFRWPQAGEARLQFALGLPICIGAILNSLNYMVPLAVLERCQASREVAFLTTSYRLFVLFELLAVAVHSISMPQLSRAAHAADWKKVGKIFRGATLQGVWILGIPLLGGAVFAGSVMGLFGDGFVSGQGVLRMLLILGFLSMLLGPADDLVLMMGHTRLLAQFTAVNLGLTLLLSFYVIPAYGAVGMAVIFGGGTLVRKALCLWHFNRHARAARRGEV